MKQGEIDRLAKIIWDYMHVNQKIEKTDIILVLGSHDIRVAERGIQLYLKKFAPIILFSGGKGRLTENWTETEANKFANLAMKNGISKNNILVENKSTNTGENVLLIKKLLASRNIKPNKVLIVQKPYMERRVYATFKKVWPEVDFKVTSPQISFDDYPNKEITKNDVVNIMIGDLQRIKLYYEKGFQIYQKVPDDVWDAYKELVKNGFDKHLIRN